MSQFQFHKNQFNLALRPFLEMLEHQKSIMNSRDWNRLVFQLVSRVTQEPEQYLGHELPPTEVTVKVVTEIFEEFVLVHGSPAELTIN